MTAALAAAPTALAAQTPPPETNAYVLIDVGPVTVPAACPGITSPFKVPESRPGWGHGSGPAAPAEPAAPSEADRARQSQQDAEDRANLPALAEDGLRGNPHATISVAHLLSWGTAVPRNDREATRWYHLAADQGHPDAARLLGFRYLHGKGVPANDAGAAYWYHAAAKQGDRVSMVTIGLLYAAGRGITQSWTAATGWWEQARSGLPIASRFLGDAYVCGLGVDQDFERAALAYRSAAEGGELSSSVQLGRLYLSGLARGGGPEIFRAFRAAADQGDPEAQVGLSGLYLDGRGVDPDPLQAYLWARLAERRVPAGELKTTAAARAAAAARLMSADEIRNTDTVIEAMLAQGKSEI